MMAQPSCGFMPEEAFVLPVFHPSDPTSEFYIRSVQYRTLFAKNSSGRHLRPRPKSKLGVMISEYIGFQLRIRVGNWFEAKKESIECG
jgi:hypothetical protein